MESSALSLEALARQQELYDEAAISDVSILFGADKKIHAHRSLLSVASAHFNRVFTRDPKNKVLGLYHDDPEAVERMFRYIYGFNVFPAPFPSTICMDIALLTLASKWEVPALVKRTQYSIAERLRSVRDDMTWSAATCTIVLEGIYGAPQGDGTLRRLAVEVCRGRMEDLVAEDKFQEALREFPELAADLLKRRLEKDGLPESRKRRHL